MTDFDKCKRCEREVIVTDSGIVIHLAAFGGLNRGCRAASFTEDTLWDDSIPRTWYAAVAK